eukprot:TRINITY_DN1543_c0_g1_i1.p1 TRINITY_DN1543_c0_g1~~TRINITY_DN1543_c0_g1_i1.p1  ORF type:complete len:209 (+),score=14.53 TRINITY_DN1543_c0_g1_i1:16-642(+)
MILFPRLNKIIHNVFIHYIFFIFVVLAFGFSIWLFVTQIYYVVLIKSERECHVLSADPISCPEAGLTQHGYNLTVEVMGSQCGVLNRESCPNDLHITESTTIPCYLDDRDCVFGFDVPSISPGFYVWEVVLPFLLALCTLGCRFCVMRASLEKLLGQKKKECKQEARTTKMKNGNNKSIKLGSISISCDAAVEAQNGNPIPADGTLNS